MHRASGYQPGRAAADGRLGYRSADCHAAQEDQMPIVRVEMFTGRTHAQKQELARAITEAVANIAHTTPEATIVVFQDVERENWAQGGNLASDDD
jgi:4-oxalocrotonate tautomerase